MRKHAIGLAAALMIGGLCATGTSATTQFTALPTVSINNLPDQKSMPSGVAASSKIPGLVSAVPSPRKGYYGQPGWRYIGVFVNDEDAKKFKDHKLDRWGRRPDDQHIPNTSTTCFSVVDHWQLKNNSDRTWHRQLEQWPQVRATIPGSDAAKQSPDYAKPRAMRIERLQRRADDAILHVQEGWYDPVTMGAKQFASYKARFKLVAKGPTGVEVYAARADEDDAVEFVVYQPLLERKLVNVTGNSMTVQRAGRHASSDCGHARLALRFAPGAGEHGSVQFDVVLPDPEDKDGKKKPKQDAKKAPPDGENRGTEIRIRRIVAHMGVSQGAKDKEPIVSVTFGWQGRERRQRIF